MNYELLNNKERKMKDKNNISFVPCIPHWDLNEIIMSNLVRESIEDAIAFCKHRDTIVEKWELKRFLKGSGGCLSINMHGNPGTGKSISAEAIAKAIDKKIIMVKLSEMVDSLQGQTEKNLSQLFDAAEEDGHVILFDEADSLLSKRSSGTNNSDATNLIKSHLLNLLDRKNAIVIFTTNFFKNYDRAFIRRILFNIHFLDPDVSELKKIWEFHLTPKVPKDITYDELAEMSIGLTGGDIKHITLKICTRLSAGRINNLNKETARIIIEEYKKSIKQEQHKEREIEIVSKDKQLINSNN